MNKHLLIAAMAVLISCCAANGPAKAQSADIKTIVSVNGPPVVLNQSSSTNMAGIFMIGGTTSATVTQTGTNNATGVLQFGGTNGAAVGQTGALNVTSVGQLGQLSNSSAVAQAGGINLSSITQIGH
ncbi:curlin [Bradyrhizobium sp. CB82]|uniref:curlin n=1 Tax=Bradyrhizobium sp. CB82 TaxID=3039159 RepID=UPI0024B122FA|nr:curlin [Bradyrhizobium sp. CB82]WFU43921.1 curlin [Bradyrhizobium sp. CB82]